MARFKPWIPSLRCSRCRRVALRDALRAWLAQPVGPVTGRGDGGRIDLVCSRCRAHSAGS